MTNFLLTQFRQSAAMCIATYYTIIHLSRCSEMYPNSFAIGRFLFIHPLGSQLLVINYLWRRGNWTKDHCLCKCVVPSDDVRQWNAGMHPLDKYEISFKECQEVQSNCFGLETLSVWFWVLCVRAHNLAFQHVGATARMCLLCLCSDLSVWVGQCMCACTCWWCLLRTAQPLWPAH